MARYRRGWWLAGAAVLVVAGCAVPGSERDTDPPPSTIASRSQPDTSSAAAPMSN
jgi:hypothetical protein